MRFPTNAILKEDKMNKIFNRKSIIPVLVFILAVGISAWIFTKRTTNNVTEQSIASEYDCGDRAEIINKINTATGINLTTYIDSFEKCFTDLTSKGYDNDIEIVGYMKDEKLNKFRSDLKLSALKNVGESYDMTYITEKNIDYDTYKGRVPWRMLNGSLVFLENINKYQPKEVYFSKDILNDIPNFGGTQLKLFVHKEADDKSLVLIDIRN